MNQLARIFTIVIISSIFSFAQMASSPNEEITLMKDSTGAEMKMDFSKTLVGISDPGMLFSHFANKNLMIYYFSPKCVHCINHFLIIKKILYKYDSKGLVGIEIGLGGGIKKTDIRILMDHHQTMIPVLHDQNYKFVPDYGTRYITVLYLVLENGTFYRYSQLTESSIAHLTKTLDSLFSK